MSQGEHQGEAYLDIVWRQFQKNRIALAALWALGPLFVVAIFVPLIASDQPLVLWEEGRTLFPWFRAIFHVNEPVDFVFNMAMLAFPAWAAAALALNRFWRRRGVPGRRRLIRVVSLYLALTAAVTALFSFPALRPHHLYSERTFPVEQFRSGGAMRGIYPPIPFGPKGQDTSATFRPPFFRKPLDERSMSNDAFPHLLGTDDAGRDVLVRMLYGTRISLTIGFLAVSIYLSIGIVVGALAGYFGGAIDVLISRVIEVVMLFPSFFLILTLVAMIGPSIYIIMVVIGVTGWPGIARLIRGEVLKQRAMEYATSARGLGASHLRVLFRHILPNAASPAMVAAPFGVANAIVTEAGLSLLGVGVRPPAPTWGGLLQLGSANYNYWWLVVVPAVAMFLTVTMFNLVGSGLRDAMDPRLRV